MDGSACAVPALVSRRGMGEAVPCHGRYAGLRVRPDRQHHLEGSRRCHRRKRGAEAAAIGRSRGGLTTKLHAVVDAIGLPIRIHPTPGQWGDRPQAEVLLAGLKGVGHVIADAGYDADPLRAFIADDLGATAHIKATPSRTAKPPHRLAALQGAPSGRMLLQQAQTLPTHRLALRENHLCLHGLRPSRLRHDLATLNADSA